MTQAFLRESLASGSKIEKFYSFQDKNFPPSTGRVCYTCRRRGMGIGCAVREEGEKTESEGS